MRHRLGTLLLVIGIGVLAWTATVYLWKDPFTTAYTAYEQRRLESNLDEQFASWEPAPAAKPISKPKPTETGTAGSTGRRRPRSEALSASQ